MTADEINALPQNVRDYIHALEARCDPAGEVRINRQLVDVNRELVASNRMLRDAVESLNMSMTELQIEMRNR